MPHITVEFHADQIGGIVDPAAIAEAAHEAAMESGLFGTQDIKVRVIKCEESWVGGKSAPHAAAMIRIMPGRTDDQKYDLADAVVQALKRAVSAQMTITAEVQDIEKQAYAKHVFSED